MDTKYGKIRTETQADIRFHNVPVRPQVQGQTHSGTFETSQEVGLPRKQVAYKLKPENSESSHQPCLSAQAAYVPNRPFDSYREAGPPRSTPHETNSVAPKTPWRIPESLEKVIPIPEYISV